MVIKIRNYLIIAIIVLGAGTMTGQAQIPVFSDTFENGSVTNSEAVTGFWTPVIPSNCTISETGGKLMMTAGDAASGNGVYSTYLYSTTSDDFNFFKRKLCFSADVSLSGNYGLLRLALTGVAGSNYSVEDALAVSFSIYNTVTLGVKQDRANTSPEAVTALVNNITLPGLPTHFDLTLDATDYTLVVYYSGGNQTFTGKHGLVAEQWGVDGKTSLQFSTTRGAGSTAGAGITVTGMVDNFIVMSYAPAAIFEDSFNNGTVTNSNAETGIWTITNPYASSMSELTGSLVQTATSTSTNNTLIVANAATPVQSRFNFFDQQLKISAAITVTGSCSAQWMERARLVLSSQTVTSSGNSPDTLMVGFRAQNNITLVAKTDAPYIEPDSINNASNRFLLGLGEAVGVYSGYGSVNQFALTINSKRYMLQAGNVGNGSGLLRFSGTHGIDRSKWGASGDSALMLETIRTTETVSGATSVGTWENLRVAQDSTKLLSEPYWEFTASYPISATTSQSGPFRLWLPTTEPVIRGIIFISPGDGDDCRYLVHDPVAQEAARAMGFGLIGMYYTTRMNLTSNNSFIKGAVQAVLDTAASTSGRPELSNVPVCITGMSRGAFDSCFLARNWPERVITFVPHCGGEWTTPGLTTITKKTPGFFVAGSLDGNSATYPAAMKPMFTWWRSQGGQVAYMQDWGTGHSFRGGQGWEATFHWMAEVAKLRYPRPMVPSTVYGVIPTLLNIDDAAGWLGDNDSFAPTVTHAFTTVASYSGYTGSISAASWLPNEACARMYRAVGSTDKVSRTVNPIQGPVRIVTPSQYSNPVVAGTTVTIAVDAREFDNTNALASMEFYEGSTWLGTRTSGPSWQWSFTPAAGMRAITVVATDVLGNKRDAYCLFHVLPANFPPLAYRQYLSTAASTPKSGTLSGTDPEGNAVTYTIAQQPSHGIVTLNANTGAFTYTGNPGYSGSDLFTFTANDGAATSDPAEVQITIASAQVGDIATVSAVPGVNTGEITLNWSAASDASAYYIERSTLSNSGFIQTATVSAPSLSYTDANLTLTQSYFYRLKAVNSGTQSNYSAIVSSLPNNPYSTVGSIGTITAAPGPQVGEATLNWSAASNATSYTVEIGYEFSGPFYALSNVDAPSLSWVCQNMSLGSVFYFRVRPFNPAYMGTYSAVVSTKGYQPPTMDTWRYLNFGTAEITDGTRDLDIPNGDGVTNLMKYALGMNLYDSMGEVVVPSPTDLPYVRQQTLAGSQYLTCTFTHNKNASDLTIVVEVANDPSGPWTAIDPFNAANQASVADNTPSATQQTIVVKDTQPITASTKRFMRVRVTR